MVLTVGGATAFAGMTLAALADSALADGVESMSDPELARAALDNMWLSTSSEQVGAIVLASGVVLEVAVLFQSDCGRPRYFPSVQMLDMDGGAERSDHEDPEDPTGDGSRSCCTPIKRMHGTACTLMVLGTLTLFGSYVGWLKSFEAAGQLGSNFMDSLKDTVAGLVPDISELGVQVGNAVRGVLCNLPFLACAGGGGAPAGAPVPPMPGGTTGVVTSTIGGIPPVPPAPPFP